MAENYKELLEKDFARQIEFLNVKKYHELGYKGKGITIFNAESLTDHGQMTTGVIKDYAPEATVLNGWTSSATSGNKIKYVKINVNEEVLDFEEAIDRYNIKIMTISKTGSYSKTILEYYRDVQKRKGIIMFVAAGNEGDDVGAWARENTAIAVSASTLKANKNIEISYYGSPNEVDFTMFMARGRGTSAASPALASFTALLLDRYGDMTQAEVVEVLKSLCYKLPNVDVIKQGWGLPILPLPDKLEILERLRGENMADFKDVEETRWSKPAIDRCVNEGLLIGFEDGTFRPTEHVTREQFAQILTRILDKIEGR